jgi:hypothetical protein
VQHTLKLAKEGVEGNYRAVLKKDEASFPIPSHVFQPRA